MDNVLLRRSIRKYDLTKKVSFDIMHKLCEAAEAAPSAKNQKSREYIIVDDKNIIDKLAEVAKGTMILNECNTVIVVLGKNPNDIPRPDMQPQDLAAATENILIAATSLKIGSCWCGIYPMEDRIEKVKNILNINDLRFPFSLVALGYPLDNNEFRDKQKFSEDILHYNRG